MSLRHGTNKYRNRITTITRAVDEEVRYFFGLRDAALTLVLNTAMPNTGAVVNKND
jgi:hypothetical protein